VPPSAVERGRVLGRVVHVDQRVKAGVGGGQHRVGQQPGLVDPADGAGREQVGRAQPAGGHQFVGGRGQGDAVGGGQRLHVPPGHRESDVGAVLGQHREHPADEGPVQERQVGGGDKRGLRGILERGQRGQPGGDALERAQPLAGVLGHQHPVWQAGQRLAGRPDDDHGAARRLGQHARRPVQQRAVLPGQRGLGGSHPGRASSGKHNARGNRHLVRIRPPRAELLISLTSPVRVPRSQGKEK